MSADYTLTIYSRSHNIIPRKAQIPFHTVKSAKHHAKSVTKGMAVTKIVLEGKNLQRMVLFNSGRENDDDL